MPPTRDFRRFYAGLALIAIVGVGALWWSLRHTEVPLSQVDPSLPALKAEGYVLGSPTAPVEVVQFADFECPACGQFAVVTEPDVRTSFVKTGKIRIRDMDFPLAMHKNSWDASMAAACANAQGEFWEMHDALFANQDRWNTEATSAPRKEFAQLAAALGLNMPAYGACMDSNAFKANIQANAREAKRRDLSATPTFVFNGTVVPRPLPYDDFAKFVEAATVAVTVAPTKPATGAVGVERVAH